MRKRSSWRRSPTPPGRRCRAGSSSSQRFHSRTLAGRAPRRDGCEGRGDVPAPDRRGGISLRVDVRAACAQPEAHAYLAARSATEIVTPHVVLTTPRVPGVVRAAALVDRHRRPHAAPSRGRAQRRSSSSSVEGSGGGLGHEARPSPPSTVTATAARLRDTWGTRACTAGSWRVQATHPADEAHALSDDLLARRSPSSEPPVGVRPQMHMIDEILCAHSHGIAHETRRTSRTTLSGTVR